MHKAPGPYELNARVIKDSSSQVSRILVLIYIRAMHQMVGDKQMYPMPLQKENQYDTENDRPVSLACICCKTLEHILVSNINKHLALDRILAKCQHGFRSLRSPETQLVEFVHDSIRVVR